MLILSYHLEKEKSIGDWGKKRPQIRAEYGSVDKWITYFEGVWKSTLPVFSKNIRDFADRLKDGNMCLSTVVDEMCTICG